MNDQILLALETSSPYGSVAVGRGTTLLASRCLTAVRKHTGELLPAIRDVLTEAACNPGDVSVLCFSQGPGSFTGLRVAATIARTWQSATGCRVVAVPSLAVIAANAWQRTDPPQRVAVVLDARQGKVFGALFERASDGTVTESSPTGLHEAEAWLRGLPSDACATGDGVAKYRAVLDERGLTALPEDAWVPDARRALALGAERAQAGRFCEPTEIVPAYHRRPECEEVYEQRRAAARAKRGE